MKKLSWIENLSCSACGKTGLAKLSTISKFENSFDLIPEGFEVIAGLRGRDFHCDTCHVPVLP